MRDAGWIIAQFAAAGLLLALSLLGVIGTLAFDAAELTFTFQGAIQAFAIFPGLVLSLVVNALVMRRHGDAGLAPAEKVLLGIEGLLIATLLVCHVWQDDEGYTFGIAMLLWGPTILLAIAVAAVAVARQVGLTRTRLVAEAPAGTTGGAAEAPAGTTGGAAGAPAGTVPGDPA